jgi:hypothetical protein
VIFENKRKQIWPEILQDHDGFILADSFGFQVERTCHFHIRFDAVTVRIVVQILAFLPAICLFRREVPSPEV